MDASEIIASLVTLAFGGALGAVGTIWRMRADQRNARKAEAAQAGRQFLEAASTAIEAAGAASSRGLGVPWRHLEADRAARDLADIEQLALAAVVRGHAALAVVQDPLSRTAIMALLKACQALLRVVAGTSATLRARQEAAAHADDGTDTDPATTDRWSQIDARAASAADRLREGIGQAVEVGREGVEIARDVLLIKHVG